MAFDFRPTKGMDEQQQQHGKQSTMNVKWPCSKHRNTNANEQIANKFTESRSLPNFHDVLTYFFLCNVKKLMVMEPEAI